MSAPDIFEKLANAHGACTAFVRSESAYPAALNELARALARALEAEGLAVRDDAGTLAAASGPFGAEWLGRVEHRWADQEAPAVIVLSTETGDPFVAAEGIERALVVLLNGSSLLALGFAGSSSFSNQELTCARMIGDHLALALDVKAAGRSPAPQQERPRDTGASAVHSDSDEKLRERLSAIDDLIAMTAHELRTPLTPLTMLLQSLERKAKNGTIDLDAILRTRKQVNRLTLMIADLLDLSRLHQDRLVLTPEAFDFGTMLTEVVSDHLENDPRHPFDFPRPERPFPVMGDRPRLAQSLASFIDHVVRTTPGDGRIRVALEASCGRAAVTFAVDRAPLPESPFSLPLPNTSARKVMPLGLAVRLAEALTTRHGGTVELDNASGTETRVRVTLPLATEESSLDGVS